MPPANKMVKGNPRGAYMLVIELRRPRRIAVGRLGRLRFAAGLYIYCGSALRGLHARIKHHLAPRYKRPHWHIDHLLRHARVVDVLAIESSVNAECTLVRNVAALTGAVPAARGFGSSDCRRRCGSHLLRLEGFSDAEDVARALRPLKPHRYQGARPSRGLSKGGAAGTTPGGTSAARTVPQGLKGGTRHRPRRQECLAAWERAGWVPSP